MTSKLLSITTLIALIFIAAGCSTAYRSELEFQSISRTKYKLGVKVYKIKKAPWGSTEYLIHDNPDTVWERGKLQRYFSSLGNPQSGIEVQAFVADSKADTSYSVEVKDKGDVQHFSKLTIKQTEQ